MQLQIPVQNFVNLTESGPFMITQYLIELFQILYITRWRSKYKIPRKRSSYIWISPGYSIDAERNDLSHTKYAVSMARSDDINSAGSQFFIMLEDSTQLDGQYTVFGHIIEGHNIIEQISMLNTTDNDQPIQAYDAMVEKVEIVR